MADALSFEPSTAAAVARRELEAKKFDQAPVVEAGMPVGFVLTKGIAAHHREVRESMVALGSGNVVSADASVGDLLQWIIEPGFLFVLEGRDVTGFITVHDFNKQPARGHLYLWLARLETALAQFIRSGYAERPDVVLNLISGDAAERVRSRYDEDRRADVESDLIAYLDFSHLVAVVAKDSTLRDRLGGWSRTRWQDEVGGLAELRNQVMHPVRNVVLAKGGLIRVHERERRIRSLVAEIEAAVGERGQ